MPIFNFSRRPALSFAATAAAGGAPVKARTGPIEVRTDYTADNPVGLLLNDRGLLEGEFAADGLAIRWVHSLGSNEALESLNAGSLDFGSTKSALRRQSRAEVS